MISGKTDPSLNKGGAVVGHRFGGVSARRKGTGTLIPKMRKQSYLNCSAYF